MLQRALPALVALAFAGASAPPAAAQAPVAIQPGATYPSATALEAPLAGVSLTVPDGYRGGWDADLGGLLLGSADGRVLAAVWGWSEATLDEVENAVAERLEAAGIRLALRDEPVSGPLERRAVFRAATDEGPGLLHAAVRAGEAGNAVAVAALGATDVEAELEDVVDRLLGSLTLSEPGAAAWRGQVEGAVLSSSSSGSDYSGGVTTATGASRSSSTLSLCPAGRYRYESVSESYVSIEGASASNESRDAHQGSWWIIADLAGNASLWLESDDGRAFHWDVEEAGEDYVVAGTRYGVSGSC